MFLRKRYIGEKVRHFGYMKTLFLKSKLRRKATVWRKYLQYDRQRTEVFMALYCCFTFMIYKKIIKLQ